MLMRVKVRYTSSLIPPITMAVTFKLMSAMESIMPCHCLFMITVMQDTGLAMKFRKSQGEMMLAISPAMIHSSPNTNANIGGPKKKRMAKMGKPDHKEIPVDPQHHGLYILSFLKSFSCLLIKYLVNGRPDQ